MKKTVIAIAMIAALAVSALAQSPPGGGMEAAFKNLPIVSQVTVTDSPPPLQMPQDWETLLLPRVNFKPPAAQASTGGGWSGSLYYDFRLHQSSAVVLNKLTDLTIRGKPTGFALYGFVGAVVKEDAPAQTGITFGYRKQFFDQVYGFGGIGISIAGGQAVGGGVLLGVGVNF
jgi:hypothetical protein